MHLTRTTGGNMPLKLSIYRPRVKANDVIAKQRIGESERIEINHLKQRPQYSVHYNLFKLFLLKEEGGAKKKNWH